ADRRRSAANATLRAAPGNFASRELNANGEAVAVLIAKIDVPVFEYHLAVVILCLVPGQKVFLFTLHAIAVFHELEQGRAGAVARGGEDVIAADDGSRNVGRFVGDVFIFPEQLAVASSHADDSAADELHILLHAAGVRNDDGRVSRAVLSPAGRHVASPDFL